MPIPRQDFEVFWPRLRQEINAGDPVRNWTKHRGYLGDSFRIHEVDSEFVKIDAPKAIKIQHVAEGI